MNTSKELPGGTVSFLFTDIEDSTRQAQQFPEAWSALLARHHAVLQHAIEAYNGYVFQIIGDAFCVAFHTTLDAINAAIDAQRRLHRESWSPATIKVRMGIHTGTAQAGVVDIASGGYTGYSTLSRVQRVMSTAYGGQILLSNASAELLRGELPAGITLRDMGENRLKGILNPERLWQVVAPDLPPDFPPLQTLNAIPNNLPIQLTSFVGREKEITELKRMLNSTRLLMLTGMGGTGKTRLSLQIAAEVLDTFKDGVWFIELASLSEPELVPLAVTKVLGLSEEQNQLIMPILLGYLKEKQLLLILDNCEHLIEACARFVDAVLHACRHVRILASSREGLGITGETIYLVSSLPAPDPREALTIPQLEGYAALRLFIERATLAQAGFTVTNSNAPAIAQICYRLDGIPLAIELAAARVKAMSVEQIAERLDDRFRLLTGGSRTAMARHMTLRSAIDWSFDLLTESERALFRRLAVFAGGWTIEAAEEICSDEPGRSDELFGLQVSPSLPRNDVLDVLVHLVDKSLVVMEEHGAETRYRLLDTIRQYARDRLLESGEMDLRREQCFQFFLQMAEEPEAGLTDKREGWINRLEEEHDNLREALEWSLENNAEAGLRLAAVLIRFWIFHNYWNEGRSWLSRLLALPESQVRIPARAKVLQYTRYFEIAKDHPMFGYRQIRAWLEESVTIYRELGERGDMAESLVELGRLHLYQDEWAQARQIFEESLGVYQGINDNMGIALVQNMLGDLAVSQGDIEQARTMYTQSLETAQDADLGGFTFWPRGNLARIVAFHDGNLAQGRSLFEESLAAERKRGIPGNIAWLLRLLADVAIRQGDYEAANSYLHECLKYAQDSARSWEMGVNYQGLAFLAFSRGDDEQAKELYQRSLAFFKGESASYAHDSFYGLAIVAHKQGKADRAIRLFAAAAAIRESTGMSLLPIDQSSYENKVGELKATVGEDAFTSAWDEGQAMTLEQSITYALGKT